MAVKIRTKYQRKLNKTIRIINKDIEKDELWRGRFVIRQYSANFTEFEDHSGGIFGVTLRMYDKKTGYYKDYFLDYVPGFDWHVDYLLNRFITEDADVWKQEPRPSIENAEDFTKIDMPDLVMRKPINWFLDFENWRDKEC